MPVEIVWAIMCGMVKSFETSSNFFPDFGAMVSYTQKKRGCDCRDAGTSPRAREAVTPIKREASIPI